MLRILWTALRPGPRLLSYVSAALAGLLLLLAPAAALAGPGQGGSAVQEEEESSEIDDHLALPRPGQFQPHRTAMATAPRRIRSAPVAPTAGSAPSGVFGAEGAARVWRPSPLLADPDPPSSSL